MRSQIKFFWLISILLLFCNCAKRGMPGGGPEDKTPPKLVETIPISGSTNISLENTSVRLIFDEPIYEDPNYVSILPDIPTKVKFRGRMIEILFTEKLAENTTYTIMLSPKLKDTRGNRVGNAITIAFSTGSELDTASIIGIVVKHNFEPVEGALLLAYEDSLRTILPIRSTISGNGGSFSLKFLPAKPLWIFALTGVSKPDFCDAEMWAIPPRKITPSGSDTLVLVLVPADSTVPKLARCDSYDSLTVKLVFSRPIEFSSIEITPQARIWQDYSDSNSIFVRWSSIPTMPEIRKICDNFSLCAKNIPIDCAFKGSDTIVPVLWFPQKRVKSQMGKQIKLVFSEPVTVLFALDTNEISLKSECSYGENFVLLPPLTESGTILLKVWDESGNYVSESLEIGILEETQNTGTLIIHLSKQICQPFSQTLFFAKIGRKIVSPSILNDEEVVLDAGRYSIWSFCDNDGNGKWTAGTLNPFRYSEEIRFFPDTVEVRTKWETEIRW